MIYDTIKDVAANQGISIYRIEKDLEFPNGLISKWNKSTPSASNLAKVAKYLGVTTEKLLGDGQEGGDMAEESLIGKYLEISGELAGRIEAETEKDLLVRSRNSRQCHWQRFNTTINHDVTSNHDLFSFHVG